MAPLTLNQIRELFIQFFTARGHTHVPSSPLIPANDPTLLFTNAGMVQFKNVFLGTESRNYTRAVTVQTCVRAGGKHNDLENVGFTARHHTFFEMLGNFSFGDYFKREAIGYAWSFLTEVLKVPTEKLWVTVFTDDDEAAQIWLKEIGVPADRIVRCDEKDNFWAMGDTGPCGPCTEIFYDHGPTVPGGPPGSPQADGDRFVEIWNLVFMQYNRDASGQLSLLPKPAVDTGMGLERIAAVMQNVHDNYETDLFKTLIKTMAAISEVKENYHFSLRVIADHIRSISFLIADGILPSNEGRGYVLRRIIRRAIRHGHKLGLREPFLYQLVPTLIEQMGAAYPKLAQQQQFIEKTITNEEILFNQTLEQGLRILNETLLNLPGTVIPGEIVFKLYDTFGFPVDITADIAREHGFTLGMAEFNECMEAQRTRSQQASRFQTDYSFLPQITTLTEFTGYDALHAETKIMLVFSQGKALEEVEAGMEAMVVLEKTPFYPESGGQIGDRGELIGPNLQFIVTDTKKQGESILHYGKVQKGTLKKGELVRALVNNPSSPIIKVSPTLLVKINII